MILPALLIVSLTLICWLWQGLILSRLGKPRLIGDEHEYVRRSKLDDPLDPEPFLRVPVMPYLAKFVISSHTNPAYLRLVHMAISALTVAVVASAGFLIGGITGLLTAGLGMMFLPERTLLSQHIWPDIPLAFLMACSCLLMILPTSQVQLWLIGAVAGLAFTTRFDAIVIAPSTWLAWQWWFPEQALVSLLPLLSPTLLSFAFLSIRNGKRHGLWLPDNTIFFNLALMSKEFQSQQAGDTTQRVRQFKQVWDQSNPEQRLRAGLEACFALRHYPAKALIGVGRRFLGFCGRETFISQILLDPYKGAYPDATPLQRKVCRYWLAFTFPIVLGCALTGFILSGKLPLFAAPTFALFLVAFLFHMRTRYRLAILPGAILFCTWSWQTASQLAMDKLGLIVAIAITSWFLASFINIRPEITAKP